MSLKVGINGFGRIGRNAFRAALANPSLGVEIVAVNDLTNPETLAHLLKYDSVHGNLPHEISATEGDLLVNGSPISVFSERDPADLRWGDNGIDVVIESTGFFTERSDAESISRVVEQGKLLFRRQRRAKTSPLFVVLTKIVTIKIVITLFRMHLVLQTV